MHIFGSYCIYLSADIKNVTVSENYGILKTFFSLENPTRTSEGGGSYNDFQRNKLLVSSTEF